MAELQEGTVIMSTAGIPITIISRIGGGGQGDVYKVDFGGETKVLKWYHPSAIKDPKAFKENLKENIRRGAPDKAFIWPEAVTEDIDGTFGYVMEFIPEGYKEFTEYLAQPGGGGFQTFKAIVQVGLKLITAFRILHNNGYSYQDLSAGNFFINPQKGDIIICDNDNVAPNGTHTGILGTPPYIAPEIIMGETKPNTHSDEYSLAVVLFMLLFTSHPLEGKLWTLPCLTPAIEKKLYGSNPVFIMDPDNTSNRPVKGIHVDLLNRWEYVPSYIKDIFIKAFSKESLQGKEVGGRKVYPRVKEFEWTEAFVRFQNEIVRCPNCNDEIFIQNSSDTPCDQCHRVYPVKYQFVYPKYTVAAVKNSIVYQCQLGTCNPEDALKRLALVVEKAGSPGVLGLKNKSKVAFKATSPSGKTKLLEMERALPLIPGVKISVYDGTFEIK
ncbi:TPA: hypothetical protein ACGO35_001817 [Streptococcus suis]